MTPALVCVCLVLLALLIVAHRQLSAENKVLMRRCERAERLAEFKDRKELEALVVALTWKRRAEDAEAMLYEDGESWKQ